MRDPLLSAAIMEGVKVSPVSTRGNFVKLVPGAAEEERALATDVLGAAFLGTLPGVAAKFRFRVQESTSLALTNRIAAELYRNFPHLGRQVNTFPSLYKRLQKDCPRVLPCGVYKSGKITRTLYRSLWGVLVALNENHSWPRERIAEYLAQAGL